MGSASTGAAVETVVDAVVEALDGTVVVLVTGSGARPPSFAHPVTMTRARVVTAVRHLMAWEHYPVADGRLGTAVT
jgi:hypothetical protein